jgi:hypothetical protein
VTAIEEIKMAANVPQRFQGTPEEAAVNRASHAWSYFDGETECMDCCAKPWHVCASYPCGTEPPRVQQDEAEAVADQMARFGAYAVQS